MRIFGVINFEYGRWRSRVSKKWKKIKHSDFLNLPINTDPALPQTQHHPAAKLLKYLSKMMTNFAYLGSVNFFPVAPRYDVLQVEYVPDEDFAVMPHMFTKKFYGEVPAHGVLTDPIGNEFPVGIVKHDERVYLIGVRNVGIFYSLHLGGYIKMVYLGLGKFITQVYTNYGDEVVYPPILPPMPVAENGLPSPPVQPAPPAHPPPAPPALPAKLLSHARQYYRTLSKQISKNDVNENYMAIPVEFGSLALPLVSSPIRVIDEEDRRWTCYLNIEMGKGVDVCLTGGWAAFKNLKGFKQGDRVKFGVITPNSDTLYYIPN